MGEDGTIGLFVRPGLRRLVHGFSESSGAHREESMQGAEAQIIGVAQEADGVNPWVNDAVNTSSSSRQT